MEKSVATGHLFVGRLPREMRSSELERIFDKFGKLSRCDVKRGSNLCYGFVEYEDPADAQDALKECNGMNVQGERIVVELTKGPARKRDDTTCFRCNQEGHWARDCPGSLGSRRSGRSRSPTRNRSPRRHRSRSRDNQRSSKSQRSSNKRHYRSPSPTRRQGRRRSPEKHHQSRNASRRSPSPRSSRHNRESRKSGRSVSPHNSKPLRYNGRDSEKSKRKSTDSAIGDDDDHIRDDKEV